MIPKIILAAILILSGIKTFSQDSIKGRIITYQTNETLPGTTIFDVKNNRNGAISDRYGNFKIEVKGDKRELEFQFIGCYRIRLINIPKVNKNIDLKEVKLVRNHLTDHIVVGGPSRPFSEYQREQDKNLRMNVLENYRINILGKNLKPYFDGHLNSSFEYLVFDFDK